MGRAGLANKMADGFDASLGGNLDKTGKKVLLRAFICFNARNNEPLNLSKPSME